ncbi:hypothetical protein L6Q96_17810 [Candidatus Binatia bacterium]|nr:hypothetical protein [Candidatus Binatia bacterium]
MPHLPPIRLTPFARRVLTLSAALAVVLPVIAGCGDDDGAPPPAPDIGTLAWVITDCEETGFGLSPIGTQRLVVRRGNGPAVTVVRYPILGPPAPTGACVALAKDRFGPELVLAGVFQRLGVLPDGSAVLFEVTDRLAYCTPEFCLTPPALPPGASGMFLVRPDGTGLRRIGEASAEPIFFEGENALLVIPSLALSPNGRIAAFTDRGPGPDGIDTVQIAALDLTTGGRRLLTRLPPGRRAPDLPATCCPGFADPRTVAFASSANPDNLNPKQVLGLFTVSVDGTNLTRLPPTEVGPDSEIDPTFVAPKGVPGVSLLLSDTPAREGPAGNVQEILLIDGTNYLQLTGFERSDTTNPVIDVHDARVFFVGSADPLGSNPSHNCQVFAVDTTGAGLTQLSSFDEAPQSEVGCNFGPLGLGCATLIFGYDAPTDTLLLYSNCDPLGTNPDGAQVFMMNAGGTNLRQVTHTTGLVIDPDRIAAQFPGPMAYQGQD